MVRARARSPRTLAAIAAGTVLLAGAVLAGVLYLTRSGFRDCIVGGTPARCGKVAVAENPANPDAKKIDLGVVVFPATGSHRKPDPVFWFAGWGGAAASDDASNAVQWLRSLNVDRDLVFIDQRGTGTSQLECPELSARVQSDASAESVATAARRCAETLGPRLGHYTSADAVDDVDRVRQKLGYDKVNIYGGSYGVTTGQIYLLRHGRHVRTATFDSGSLLDVRIFERSAANAQRALDLLFARCAADTACRTAYPNLRKEFARIEARLAKAPLPVPGSPVPLTPITFAGVVEEALTGAGTKAQLPRLIHLVATGQLRRAGALVRASDTAAKRVLAYQFLIDCNEPWASLRPAAITRVSRGTFGAAAQRFEAQRMVEVCKVLPKVRVPASIGQRVRSNVPVLFLQGDEDPADPPGNVAHARRELPNSRTVVFPGSGHGQIGLLCAQNLLADFVATASTAGLATTCTSTAIHSQFEY